jgi:hypothetical protein
MTALRILTLLALLGTPFKVPPPGLPPTGGTTSGPIRVNGAGTQATVAGLGDCSVFDDNGNNSCTRIADEAPNNVLQYAESAWGKAATNTSGANLVLAGGLGQRRIAMTTANCSGDTITLTLNGTANVGTENGTNDATHFDCTGETDTTCATNVATWANQLTGIDACAGTGCSTTAGFSGTAGTVYIYRDTSEPAAWSVLMATSDATCAALTSGSDGQVFLGSATTTQTMGLVLGAASSTSYPAIRRNGTTVQFMLADYSAYAPMQPGNITVSGTTPVVTLDASAGYINQWGGSAYDTSLYRSAAGKWRVGTGTQGTSAGTYDTVCYSATLDFSSAAKQTVFTVPTAKVWHWRSVAIQDCSATVNTATWTAGCDANASDAGFGTMSSVTFNGSATLSHTWFESASSTEGAAAATCGIKTVAQEGAADTCVVQVCGSLDN